MIHTKEMEVSIKYNDKTKDTTINITDKEDPCELFINFSNFKRPEDASESIGRYIINSAQEFSEDKEK